MRLFQSHQHFLLYVDVYVHRRASVRASVSVAFKGDPVSIGKLERFVADYSQREWHQAEDSRREKRQKGCCHRFRPVQDLHVPEIWQSLAMM